MKRISGLIMLTSIFAAMHSSLFGNNDKFFNDDNSFKSKNIDKFRKKSRNRKRKGRR